MRCWTEKWSDENHLFKDLLVLFCSWGQLEDLRSIFIKSGLWLSLSAAMSSGLALLCHLKLSSAILASSQHVLSERSLLWSYGQMRSRTATDSGTFYQELHLLFLKWAKMSDWTIFTSRLLRVWLSRALEFICYWNFIRNHQEQTWTQYRMC